jgi:hypothetical protein
MEDTIRARAISNKAKSDQPDETAAYSSPQLIAIGSAVELLQRQPSGANADRGIRKAVVVARKPKKTKKK